MTEFGDRLNRMLLLHEDIKLTPYRCTAGKLTIGVGRNLQDRGISRSEAFMMLSNDIAECQLDMLSFDWFADLDEVRQAVLLDMRFNLGAAGIRKFKNTLGLIQSGKYTEAADAMLQSLWAKQVGQRAHRLSKMMRTGQWPKEVLL